MSATISLLDANVWLALAADFHPHHSVAKDAWDDLCSGGIGFNRVSQMGFLRLLTNPVVMGPNARTNRQAWKETTEAFKLSGARDLSEPARLFEIWSGLASGQNVARDAWTDCYLAAFALGMDLRFVTFDRGFKRFKGLDVLILEPR